MTDGNVTYAGEAFTLNDAATMTGAWASGKKAGADVLLALTRDSGQKFKRGIPSGYSSQF